MHTNILSERLRALRNKRELNIEALEKETGISKSTLSIIENLDISYQNTSISNVITLADYYNVSIDYLFGRSKSMDVLSTEISELSLSDEAVLKLKTDNRHGRLLSLLILTEGFDELLNKIEIMLDGHMEPAYVLLNQCYSATYAKISKVALSEDEITNLLSNAKYDSDFEKYQLQESFRKLLDELEEKFGKKVLEDKGIHTDIEESISALAECVGIENPKKLKLKDFMKENIFEDMLISDDFVEDLRQLYNSCKFMEKFIDIFSAFLEQLEELDIIEELEKIDGADEENEFGGLADDLLDSIALEIEQLSDAFDADSDSLSMDLEKKSKVYDIINDIADIADIADTAMRKQNVKMKHR